MATAVKKTRGGGVVSVTSWGKLLGPLKKKRLAMSVELRLARAYYKWVWPSGYSRSQHKHIGEAAKARYRAAIRGALNGYDIPEADAFNLSYERDKVICERCLRRAACVLFVNSTSGIGLLSDDGYGDFICNECDPRVEGIIVAAQLNQLVNPG